MKKRITGLLLAVTMLSMAACGTEEKEIEGKQTESASVPEETQDTFSEESSAEKEASEENFYGSWRVEDFYAPGVTALSESEMESFIYVKCEYAKNSFTVEGAVLEGPQYGIGEITKEDFAESFHNQVTFDALEIAGESICQVSVDNAADFGSSFYVADENTIYIAYEGAFFKAVRQTAEDIAAFTLTEEGKAFLKDMCRYLPAFSGHADMDEAFWKDFIFYYYTDGQREETEIVSVYREDLGFDEKEAKVSLEEVEEQAALIFGVELPDIKPAFADMKEGQTALYYEDGYYYIGLSDFPDYQYTYADCTVYEERYSTCALVEYRADFQGEENAGAVTFLIYPADNANGFIINAKETELY